MIKRFLLITLSALGILSATAAFASDERAFVTPEKDGQFTIERQKMPKNQLLAYLADLQERKHITAVVLKRASNATDMQKHLIKEMGDHLKIEALSDESGDLKPLVDPTPIAPAAAPASSS
ncbi:hypothetical protein ELE36_14185 [Pseudolysobacter antarcticus]|uniref:Uncharacterized protein n=1 Tax=Pseudolysobacter antarcticus TaxID=2511995 RepID=A0A411HLY9_9GAMM|nr:hypothetical protein [Pseudolysobacter antarcticus]QBB71410.1 hypothetical protein ELE36_14185 [Pseudolysobacter antarcticus]